MIIVDVGCHPQPPEESTRKLIDRFRPALYFGFDPFPALIEGVWPIDATTCVFSRRAAWTADGTVAFSVDGIVSSAIDGLMTKPPCLVPCFDFAAWVAALPRAWVGLKLDCEGAEYPLLERVCDEGLDDRLAVVLVEWHDEADPDGTRKQALEERLRCPVELWA